MFGDLALVLSKVGVVPSNIATYSPAWKTWMKWRQYVVNTSVYLDVKFGEELVAERSQSLWHIRNSQEGIRSRRLMGRFSGYSIFHRRLGY